MTLKRTRQAEMLDELDERAISDDLRGNLRDIRRANRWFGGTRAVVAEVAPLLREHTSSQPLSILDIATGSADIPIAIACHAEQAGCPVRIVATDLQPAVLALAGANARAARIRIERADALALPYADGEFEVVTLSLALHHFEPDDAVRVLGEIARVGYRSLIVNDLERSRAGLASAWLFSHLLTTNRLTRNDAPLSVRRAYTTAEALALAHQAGWREARVRGIAPYRFLLTGRPS